MALDLLVVFALILVNGFLALSELAVVSSRRARLQALAESGSAGARVALHLAGRLGHFLSAVQIGITLVGLLAGAFSGTRLAEPLEKMLEEMGVGDTASGFLAFGLVMSLVTYLSLIVGELVPKQIALMNPERMAVFVAPPMALLTRVAWPLVLVLEASSRFVLGLLGTRPESRARVTSEEVKSLIAEAERAGIMPARARTMMAGVMRLGERRVRAVMTPRSEVDWIDLEESDETIRERLRATRHSRLPAGRGTADTIAGVIRAKDVLDAYLAGQCADAREFVREVPVVIESLSALKAMEVLRSSGEHMVLVVDEYGVFQGLITTTNMLETIAGAFPATEQELPPGATRRADGSWLLDGDLPVDEMAEALTVVLRPGRHYSTVAGFVLAELMHLPSVGETFVYRGWRFEVVDLDGRRIDKILAVRVSERRRAARSA